MRVRYNQPADEGRSGVGAVSVDWRQEWFTNLCLSIILAVTLFLMLLSIYLVFSKPTPALTPSPNQTETEIGGAAFALNNPDAGSLWRDIWE